MKALLVFLYSLDTIKDMASPMEIIDNIFLVGTNINSVLVNRIT